MRWQCRHACVGVKPEAVRVRLPPPAAGTPDRKKVRLTLPPPVIGGGQTVTAMAVPGPLDVTLVIVGGAGRLRCENKDKQHPQEGARATGAMWAV